MSSPVAVVVRAPGSMLGRVVAEGRGIWTEGRAFAQGRNVDGSARKLTAAEMSLAWFLGLTTMGAAGVVPWSQVGLITALQAAERATRDRRMEEFLQGIETAA